MKNQVQKFYNEEFGPLEILLIDDKPYFPATECAKVLGYKDPAKAVRMHCKGVDKMATPSAGGIQMTNYIPEGDLYRLIIRSKLPAVERFERWVFDELIPTIRKYGAYVTADTLDEMLRNPKFAESLMRKLKEEREKNAELMELNEELTEFAEELAPKALYCDTILQSENLIPVSLIAKDYGYSAVGFNNLLHELRIQFKIGGCWLLYQEYAKKGYTQTRTYYVKKKASVIHTYWTQKGRLFLYETLKRHGIFPLIEKHAVAG
ncbi:MAG: phage antirepressor KilAC domain-containing protein [Oscillospiraceae bacterium]|nr:phage antirepressor KilAC domain-containing protein [Oscillospiraceae bacterium]